jgi:GNAT superfamily N-acetyltransferase
MTAYFDGNHHPQQALPPRVGYLALAGDGVTGYIAGHLTTRHGCAAEVQYLFVAPECRRRGVATALLRLLTNWFGSAGVRKVCVCVDPHSPGAKPFYESTGASPFRQLWYRWDDISVLRS